MSSGKKIERIKKVMLTTNIMRDKIRSDFVIFLSSMKNTFDAVPGFILSGAVTPLLKNILYLLKNTR